jgi:chromosome segregation ATPase
MTNEMDSLGILEEKIIQLVEAFAVIKTEKTALAEKLSEKEKELNEFRGKVRAFSDEREKVQKKVENLLNRIDRLVTPGKQG